MWPLTGPDVDICSGQSCGFDLYPKKHNVILDVLSKNTKVRMSKPLYLMLFPSILVLGFAVNAAVF